MEANAPCSSFEQIAASMGELVAQGKIKGWGMCNDNTYGLMGSIMAARQLGVEPPCVMQNDYSLINRRVEENGLSEASAPWNENVGFLGYNVLAGGMLTGKYLNEPAAQDDKQDNKRRMMALGLAKPRGRMDVQGWGRTLYRYRSGPALEATKSYAELAAANGMSLTELALKWCRSRPACTSTLLGSSSLEQLEEALAVFQQQPVGSYENGVSEYLDEELLWEIDRVHMRNRLPIFASTKVQTEWNGRGQIGEPIP